MSEISLGQASDRDGRWVLRGGERVFISYSADIEAQRARLRDEIFRQQAAWSVKNLRARGIIP